MPPCRLGFLLLASVLPFLEQRCGAQQKIPEAEKSLFDSANQERAERKLPPLKWDEGLARAAHKHAQMMAEQDLLEHRLSGEPDLPTRAREAGANFSHITENIGMAVSVDKFHDGWMHSPGHRANILDAYSNSVGIAVVEAGEELYAVEDFSRAVVALSVGEQEKRVKELLASRGLHLLDLGNDARKSCELDRDYVGNSKPKYIAHYEAPDISQLPETVEKEIQSHRYKSAAVGACPQREASGFRRFRIVVLLY
ncbi:MAG TPA: CAP domain-containing protein [Candidatus Acidoferrum sp.]|nr:CAP domain-containing protein [Candidatus Acidoferrum sp.]